MPMVSSVASLAVTPAQHTALARPSFGAALRQAEAAHVGARPPKPIENARAALEALERAWIRLDVTLEAARNGRTFTAQELLALQADAYRFSQTVEVAAKVVEQGAQAVKQTVNTQV